MALFAFGLLFADASCDDVGCDLEALNSPDFLKELLGPLFIY